MTLVLFRRLKFFAGEIPFHSGEVLIALRRPQNFLLFGTGRCRCSFIKFDRRNLAHQPSDTSMPVSATLRILFEDRDYDTGTQMRNIKFHVLEHLNDDFWS
jgi:hypothetical protein